MNLPLTLLLPLLVLPIVSAEDAVSGATVLTSDDLIMIEYQDVSFVWTSKKKCDAVLKVRLENRSEMDIFKAIATISHSPENTEISDSEVEFGTVRAGEAVWSKDSFRIGLDTSHPSDPKEGLKWTIEYDDQDGKHHIVRRVPQSSKESEGEDEDSSDGKKSPSGTDPDQAKPVEDKEEKQAAK